MGRRPKSPTETKAELTAEVDDLLKVVYLRIPDQAVHYLLNNFTTFDLIAMRDELREMKRRGKAKANDDG